MKDVLVLIFCSLGNFKIKMFVGVFVFIEFENMLVVIDDYNNGIGDGIEYFVVVDFELMEID